MYATKLPGWPGIVAHELTHALAALPFAEVDVRLAGGFPHVRMTWAPETPMLAIRAAHLAPTILGAVLTALTTVVLGPAALAMLPANPFHALAIALLVGYNWILFVCPSPGDLDPFGSGGGES